VKALPAALALGLDSWGDLVAIVVEARKMHVVLAVAVAIAMGHVRLGLGRVFSR
jgi:hypothetical protein